MNIKTLLPALALALLAPAVHAALEAGTAAPDFKAPASLAGKEFSFSLAEALKKGPVVVYFYPSAYTQGCNVQAHTFAENIDKFHAAGATVVGVSLDSIERLNEFSADPEYCAGKLPVASDAKAEIARSYGLKVIDSFAGKQAVTMLDSRGKQIGHEFTERVTFVVVPGSKIANTIGGVSPEANVKAALAAVQALKASK
jgi:thioredoxin-dependent peroxiredoxin